jgi:hypothetical protein
MSFEGEIGEIDLIEKLVGLGSENFTGAIRFENDGIIKIVYFKGGDILSASTNDRSDSIDEILLRAGKVTREHVKQALARRKESETLGDAMLGLGFITRKELTWARRAQAIGILRSLRGWEAGQYTIVADYLPKREEGTLFPLSQMLVELIVTEQDRGRFDRATDGGAAVFQKTAGFDEQFRKLGLNQDAEEIAQQIDGDNTAADVAAASGKDAFNVYKLLEALRVLGLLTKARGSLQVSPQVVTHDDFAGVGVADAADAWNHDPTFDLDDTPAVAVADPELEPAPVLSYEAPTPGWDYKPDYEPAHEPSPEMPAWDERPTRTPVLAAADLPLEAEPEWGFDEAQLETARRAAAPVRGDDTGGLVGKAPKRKGPSTLLYLILVGVILGAGGWYGWQWWQAKQAANAPQPAAQAVAQTRRPHPVIPAPAPAPAPVTETAPVTPAANALVITPTQTASTQTTATTATITTATVAPPPAPASAPVTAPVTATVAPTPVRIAKSTPPPPAPATTTGIRLERPANGNPSISNNGSGSMATSASPASADATRARYDTLAKQHASSANGGYAIQFELVCETASLSKAISAGGDKVWFTPLSYRGKSCYRVYWGHYGSAAEATAAVSEIPTVLREGSTPVVQRVTKP